MDFTQLFFILSFKKLFNPMATGPKREVSWRAKIAL